MEMRIITNFSTIPDRYGKRAPADLRRKGRPVVSFPFQLSGLPDWARYLHWELVDPDSIPVCGFQWIHWSLANLPLSSLSVLTGEGSSQPKLNKEDQGNGGIVDVPEDFSRRLNDLIPGVPQGRNSSASRLVMEEEIADDPEILMRYNGPQPPDRAHDYVLRVWATAMALPGLEEGFWLNALEHAIHDLGPNQVMAEAWLPAQS